jgi:hypothetical protein
MIEGGARPGVARRAHMRLVLEAVIASEAKQSISQQKSVDCVASLAMTFQAPAHGSPAVEANSIQIF